MRHVVFFNMIKLIVFTKIWNSLNKKLRKHVRKFDKKTMIEKFIKNLKNATNYYVNNNKKMQSKSHINVKWNRFKNKFRILNVLIDIQNHILKIIQRFIFSNFKMINRHVIDKHFFKIFTFFHRRKIDRNIYNKIRFLQFKMYIFNVTFSTLRV